LSRWLVISDLQIPFEARDSLKFCKSVQKEFKIPNENILCVGDETDQYFGGLWKKSADGWYTANQELDESRRRLRQWYRAFPLMRVAISNHGTRWARKASEAEIPSQLMRAYRDIIEAPPGWKWAEKHIIKAKYPFQIIHGLGYGGMYAYRHVPLDQGISTAFGHLHSNAGIAQVVTEGQKLWGMNTGCLIDNDAYAFEYGKYNRFKPWLGCGVVLDDGRWPILVPYEAL